MDALKPCPFCGRPPRSWDDQGVVMVRCTTSTCHLSGGLEIPADPWNTRPLEDALLEALQEIAKGEGPFSRDPLTHAANTIEHMTAIAQAAIAKATGRG